MSTHSSHSSHSSSSQEHLQENTTATSTTPTIIKQEYQGKMMAYPHYNPQQYHWYDPRLYQYPAHAAIMDTQFPNGNINYQAQVACASPSVLSHSPSVNGYPSPRLSPATQLQTHNLAVSYAPSSPATSMSYYEPLTPQSPQQNSYNTPSQASKKKENVCNFPGCKTKGKFERKTDLNRHHRTQHDAANNMEDCHHGWCGRTGNNGFSRKDHLREHLREVHREDIPFRNARKTTGNKSPKQKVIKTEDSEVKAMKRRA